MAVRRQSGTGAALAFRSLVDSLSGDYVVSDLEAELVAGDVLGQLTGVQRIELHRKPELPWLVCKRTRGKSARETSERGAE